MVKIGAKETVKYMSVYGSAIAVTSIAADNTIENHKKNGKVVKQMWVYNQTISSDELYHYGVGGMIADAKYRRSQSK